MVQIILTNIYSQTANIPSITYHWLHQINNTSKKVLKETFPLQLGLSCLNPQACGQTVLLLACVKAVDQRESGVWSH